VHLLVHPFQFSVDSLVIIFISIFFSERF
jgi:hypothetical protein